VLKFGYSYCYQSDETAETISRSGANGDLSMVRLTTLRRRRSNCWTSWLDLEHSIVGSKRSDSE